MHREIVVKNAAVLITVAMMVVGGAVGCTSGPAPVKLQPGALPPGTARLSVDGKDTESAAVQCLTVESVTMIATGADTSGATVMVSNAEKPVVESVTIRNLNGFTGSYNLGLDGKATVAMTGRTYDISGTVRGYGEAAIEPTTAPFGIKVSC